MNKLVDLNGMQMMAETISQKIQSSSGSGGGIISSDSVATLQSTYDPGNHKYVMSINQASGLFPIVFTASHAYHYGDKIELNGVLYDVVPYGGNLRDGIWGAGSLVSGYVDIDTRKFHVSIPETDGTYTIGDSITMSNMKIVFEPLGDLSYMSEFDCITLPWYFGYISKIYRLGSDSKFFITGSLGQYIVDLSDMSCRDVTVASIKSGSTQYSFMSGLDIFQVSGTTMARLVSYSGLSGYTVATYNCETKELIACFDIRNTRWPTDVTINRMVGYYNGSIFVTGKNDSTWYVAYVDAESLEMTQVVTVSTTDDIEFFGTESGLYYISKSGNYLRGIRWNNPDTYAWTAIDSAAGSNFFVSNTQLTAGRQFVATIMITSSSKREAWYYTGNTKHYLPQYTTQNLNGCIVIGDKVLTPQYSVSHTNENICLVNLDTTATPNDSIVRSSGFTRSAYFVYADDQFLAYQTTHPSSNQNNMVIFFCKKQKYEIIG